MDKKYIIAKIKNKENESTINNLQLQNEILLMTWKESIKHCLPIYIFSKLIIFCIIYFCFWMTKSKTTLIELFTVRWDSGYFIELAKTGNFKGAFFPFYPLLIKIFSLNSLFSIELTAIIINQIMFFLAMCTLLIYLQSKKILLNDAKFGIVLLAVSPVSIFFIATYSETTFLLFSILGFYFLHKNKPNEAAFMGMILTATRATGMAFLLAFVYDRYKKNGIKLSTILQSVLICSGLLLYCVYTKINTGDFLSFYHAQANWGRTGWITLDIGQNIDNLLNGLLYSWTRDSLAFFIALFLTLILILNRFIPEAIFNLFCILPGFISGSSYGIFYSGARLDIAIITFYIGMVLVCKNKQNIKFFVIAFSTLLLVESWFMWIVNAWLD